MVVYSHLGALSFTLDKEFLREFYPVLKGAAEFCMDWLVEKDGKLVTSPEPPPKISTLRLMGMWGLLPMETLPIWR